MRLESVLPPRVPVRRCLVVDDSPVSRDLFRSALRRIPGVRVTLAADGAEALRALSRERFDLVLADLDAPVLGALALSARLSGGESGRSVPVVVVAAGREEDLRPYARELGVSAWMRRPVQAATLQRVARGLLNIP